MYFRLTAFTVLFSSSFGLARHQAGKVLILHKEEGR